MPTTEKHLEGTVLAIRHRIERSKSYGGNYLYYGNSDAKLDCDAADLIEAQAASLSEAQERCAGMEKELADRPKASVRQVERAPFRFDDDDPQALPAQPPLEDAPDGN